MKIKYSTKLIFAAALINVGLLSFLFYFFVIKNTSAEEMKLRCNIEMLENNLIGKPLPEYNFADRSGTNAYNELTRGKVLLVFFLTHCQACLTEFDFLKSNFKENESDFKIAAVTSESDAFVSSFISEHNLNFPVYRDVEGSLMLKTRIACTPTLIFLEEGKVKKIKIGNSNNYNQILEGFNL